MELVGQLRLAAQTLPETVPEGRHGDGLFSGFQEPPCPDPSEEEHEIFFNKSLHSAFGWNETAESLSKRLTRGPMGVEALCGWLEVAITKWNLQGGILEPRVERMLEAITLR